MLPHHINHVLITEEQLARRVDELAREIATHYKDRPFVVAGVLRGSFMFIADLVRALHRKGLQPRIDFTTLESYGSGTISSGNVRVIKDISVDLKGEEVLLVDDILDTGRTLRFAARHMDNKGAGPVKTCTLLDKPSRRLIPIHADFSGFTIEDRFVVGYGLDYDTKYRELPFISEVTFL